MSRPLPPQWEGVQLTPNLPEDTSAHRTDGLQPPGQSSVQRETVLISLLPRRFGTPSGPSEDQTVLPQPDCWGQTFLFHNLPMSCCFQIFDKHVCLFLLGLLSYSFTPKVSPSCQFLFPPNARRWIVGGTRGTHSGPMWRAGKLRDAPGLQGGQWCFW